MNNVSQISKAKRLSEEEVHAAAEELESNGVRVSSIELYKHLGRGSLTTITNFLRTWHPEENATSLPNLTILPETLKKTAEQLLVKLWTESQELAEKEINTQREALRQAEALAKEKIAEAEAFSEEQSKQIEALEAEIELLKKEKEEDHVFFLSEEKRLQVEITHAKKGETIFEQRFIETNKQLESYQSKNERLQAEIDHKKEKLAEQIILKNELEKRFKKAEEVIQHLEILNAEKKEFEITTSVQKIEIEALTINLKKEKEFIELATIENKNLREKAAMLEGELNAWKSIKPELKKKTVKKEEDVRSEKIPVSD